MVMASFEHEGNVGSLEVITHFNKTHVIACDKHDGESFRLGGTAVNEMAIYEGVILNLPLSLFRAFTHNSQTIEDHGILSPEAWTEADLHCYVHEFYPLEMEGKAPTWFLSKQPLQNAHHIFINLDILDGGGNVLKRYRVSPLTGEYKIMEFSCG